MSSASKSKSLKLSSGESLRKSFSKGFKKFNSMLTPRTEKAHQEKVNPEKQQPPAGAKDVEKPKEEAKPAEQVVVVKDASPKTATTASPEPTVVSPEVEEAPVTAEEPTPDPAATEEALIAPVVVEEEAEHAPAAAVMEEKDESPETPTVEESIVHVDESEVDAAVQEAEEAAENAEAEAEVSAAVEAVMKEVVAASPAKAAAPPVVEQIAEPPTADEEQQQEKLVVEEPTPMFEGVVTEAEEAAKSPVAPQSPEVQDEIVKSPDAAAETDSSNLASTVIETAPVDEVPEAVAEPLVAAPVEGPAEVEEAVVKRGLGPLGVLSIAGAVAVGVVLGVKGPLRRRQSA